MKGQAVEMFKSLKSELVKDGIKTHFGSGYSCWFFHSVKPSVTRTAVAEQVWNEGALSWGCASQVIHKTLINIHLPVIAMAG